jgi:hypothetical protein
MSDDTNGEDITEPRRATPPSPPPTPGLTFSGDLAPLFAALAKAQGEFGEIHRSATVTIKPREGAAYSFSYAPLDEVLDAVRPALSKNGLWLGQPLSSAGGRHTLRTILAHSSGASMMMTTELAANGDIKALGSAITYMRRYTVQALLGVAAEEDDDGSAANGDGYERTKSAQRPPRTNGSPAAAPTNGLTATEGDLKTMLTAIGNAPSTEYLKTLSDSGKARPWSAAQKAELTKAYAARKAALTDAANDAQEPPAAGVA